MGNRSSNFFKGWFLAERIFRGFLFLGCWILPQIFSPDFFSFLWEKVPRKVLQENPQQNPPKIIRQKSPTHFCRGAGPSYFRTIGEQILRCLAGPAVLTEKIFLDNSYLLS